MPEANDLTVGIMALVAEQEREPEVAAHVLTVTETAHRLEWQDWAAPILTRP